MVHDILIPTVVKSSIPREPAPIIPCLKARWRRPAYNSLYCNHLDQWVSDKVCLHCNQREEPKTNLKQEAPVISTYYAITDSTGPILDDEEGVIQE